MSAAARLERDGELAVITLDSPPLNLFDQRMMDDLRAAIDEVAATPPRALLIRAEGRAVSGGVDVEVFAGLSPEQGSALWTELLEMIDKVSKSRQQRIPTSKLNRFVEQITTAHAPVSPGKREVRVLYASQTAVAPPEFVLFTNVATTFHFSYERFVVNRLREEFGFVGTPIRLHIRKRSRS